MRPVPIRPFLLSCIVVAGLAGAVPAAAQRADAPVAQRVDAPVAQRADAADCALYAASAMIEAQLFFGRNIGADLGVSERDWSDFLDKEVTPRFPDGLTVIDASGHWRDMETGRLIREPSKVITLLAGNDPATLRLIREIVDLYKDQFHQQSVGLSIRPVCVSF